MEVPPLQIVEGLAATGAGLSGTGATETVTGVRADTQALEM